MSFATYLSSIGQIFYPIRQTEYHHRQRYLVLQYLLQNIVYPKRAMECCKEGTEVVKFTITPTGNITDIEIVNCVCCEIDDEVIRVLKETDGKWISAYKNGKAVENTQELAIVFCDRNSKQISEYFVTRATVFFNEGNKKLLEKHKPKKALALYASGLRYLPDDKGLLFMHGVANFELGNEEAARNDFIKVSDLGGIDYNKFDLTGTKCHELIQEVFAEN